MSTPPQFDGKSYWERRFSSTLDISTVGYAALGMHFNRWMYRLRRSVFLRTVATLRRERPVTAVLDVGAGSGFYLERWRELGVADIRACDLTETAVQWLRARYPGDDIFVLDVGGDPELLPAWQVDVISAMDVIFHIVDDAQLEQAFQNMFRLLHPGGFLIFTDNFVHSPKRSSTHHVSRSKADLEGAVRAAGFEIVSRRAAFFLMNEPVDSDSALLGGLWRAIAGALARAPAAGGLLGAVLFPIDAALVRLLREGPSTEIMVARKPRASPKAGPARRIAARINCG